MIVFDIDGTLSIVGDRLKYIQGGDSDWNSFYGSVSEDKPNQKIVRLLNDLSDRDIIFVTGRRESCRSETLIWLRRYIIRNINTLDLFMRRDGDTRSDTEVKPGLIQDYIDTGAIEMIFEDRNSMVKKWRSLGLTCLQVAEGDF